MSDSYENRGDVERDIRTKAASDSEFRQQLLGDPKGTLGSLLGKSVPDGLDVKVAVEGENELCIAIPPALSAEDAAGLSADDLDNVAGGATPAAAATVAASVWTSNIVGEITKW